MNSSTRIRDITDGTSNTIALSERVWMYSPSQFTTPTWAGAWSGGKRTDKDTRWVRSAAFGPEKPINGGTRSNTSISSLHTGGVHIALFDGSARFLSENIDHFQDPGVVNPQDDAVDSTFEYLIAIADQQVIGEF